jgi:carbon-monoxide dehydrogenase large subunit
MVLEGDGTVSRLYGSSSVGQGVETVMAQIAADALDMPMARINRVQHGSTTHVKYGLRLLLVALDRDGRLGHRAGGRQPEGCDPRRCGEAPAMRACGYCHRRRQCGWSNRASVALSAVAADGIASEGTYASNKRTYSYGAHAAHVAVDPRTGHVALIDYMAVEDARPHHQSVDLARPDRRRHRAGLGGALLEHLAYDSEGQFLVRHLGRLPVADRERLSGDPRPCAGGKARAAQSARRQRVPVRAASFRSVA